MADAGLFIGWGEVVRGKEDLVLEVFNETIEFYGQLQSDGRVEDFDFALLRSARRRAAGLRDAPRKPGSDRRGAP